MSLKVTEKAEDRVYHIAQYTVLCKKRKKWDRMGGNLKFVPFAKNHF